MLQKYKQVQPVVCQCHLEPGHGGLCMLLILLVDVGQQAPSCKVFLLVAQPGCCGWVIRKEEAREDSNADRDYTLLRTETTVSSRSGLAWNGELTMMNSHLQLANPISPSRFPKIPAASRPPNILARALPE